MKLLLTLLGFATMLLAPSVEAGVIDACVGGNGNLRLVSGRQDCKNNESHLQWNEVGPAGPQGLPGIDGIDGRDGDGLVAVDGEGSVFGSFVYFDTGSTFGVHRFGVYSREIDALVRVDGRNGFLVSSGTQGGSSGERLLFDGSDCTGQAYTVFRSQDGPLHLFVTYIGGEARYFAPRLPGVILEAHTVFSRMFSDGACDLQTQTLDLLPVQEITLPFSDPALLPISVMPGN